MTRQDLVNKSIDKLNTVKEALELIEILEYDECIAVLTGTKNLPSEIHSALMRRGKEVDGMKRPREPPTGGNKMNIGRILPTEAAAILNVSPQFVRVAMQQGKLPIGTAVQMSSIWTYHISEKLLADYSGKNIEKEIERIRGGVEK